MKSEEEDHGKFECVAENSIGTEFSKPTVLYVKGKFTDLLTGYMKDIDGFS